MSQNNFSTLPKGTTPKIDNNYKKFESTIMFNLNIKAITSFMGFVTLMLLFFLPIFDVLGIENISIMEEARFQAELLFNEETENIFVPLIFTLLLWTPFIAGALWYFYSFVKCGVYYNSFDLYALIMYEKGKESGKKMIRGKVDDLLSFGSLILLIIFSSVLIAYVKNSDDFIISSQSLFFFITDVAGVFWLAVVSFIVAVVLQIFKWYNSRTLLNTIAVSEFEKK